MTAAATAAALSREWFGEPATGREVAAVLSLVVAGGLVEGTALGVAQSAGLRDWLPGLPVRRWVVATVVVAGLGWAAASAPSVLAGDDGEEPARLLVLLGAAALGAVLGTVLGAAQATALRAVVQRPRRWVGISVTGWVPAMVVLFVGATTPAQDWSVAAVAATGAVTGLVAGAVLGLVTGRLLPRLEAGGGPADDESR